MPKNREVTDTPSRKATQTRMQLSLQQEIESLESQLASRMRALEDSRFEIATLTKQRDEERLHYQHTESKQLCMQSSLRRENELLKNDNDRIKSQLENAQGDIASIKSVRNKVGASLIQLATTPC